MKCPKCKDDVIDFVECSECQGAFHYGCAGVTETTYRKMSADKKATWKCITCRNPDATAEILRQIKSMREEFGEVRADVRSTSALVQELYSKWEELEPRLTNIEDRLSKVEKKSDMSTKLQSELKSAHDVIANLQTDNQARDQYARINNMEISGIPLSSGENLHSILLSICNLVGVQIDIKDVDAIHRVRRFEVESDEGGSKKRPPAVVVKFCRRATKDALLAAVRARRGLTTADIQLPGPATAVYVGDHLTPSNKLLLKQARQLKADRNYAYLWTRDYCLHLQLYRGPQSSTGSSTSWATLSLQHFLGLESGFTLDREAHTLALICSDHVLVLAFDTRERLIAWQVKVGNHLGPSQEFLVVVPPPLPAASPARLPAGPARLHLRRQRFALTSGTPPNVMGVWELQHLRRYGVVEGRFAWEGGLRCGALAGGYCVAADRPQTLRQAFDNALQGHTAHGTPHRKSTTGAELRDKTRPSTRLSDINTIDRSFPDSASGIYEENFFGDDCRVSPSWPDERRMFDDPSRGQDISEPPWGGDHVTLQRCSGCLTKLAAPRSPPALFSPAWTMEGTPESNSDSSSNNTEYLTPRMIRKSLEACRCKDGPPERPPKTGHLEQKKPPAPLPAHCECPTEEEHSNSSKIGPYKNYDVPKTSRIEQVITSDYYDTPKRVKQALTEDLFQVTNTTPGSLVLKKNCGCILKLGSKKKPLVVECEENLQPVDCPCLKVTNWANNLISLPYCKKDPVSDKINTEVLTHKKAEDMAIYATVDVSRKTNRQSGSVSEKDAQENIVDTTFTNYQNVEPEAKENFEGPNANYENLEFALSLEYYENAKDLLKRAGVTQSELDALSANLGTISATLPKKPKICLKCGHSQKHKHTSKSDEYLLMEPSDIRKEQCPTIIPNPGYTPMCPNPKWSQSLKHPLQKFDRIEIEKSASIPALNGSGDKSRSPDVPSSGIRESIQQRSASVDSTKLLEDMKEFDSSIGSHATSSSLETLRNLAIEHRRSSSPSQQDTECYDCCESSSSEKKTSTESSIKGTAPFRNKTIDTSEIKRCSSVPGKAGGNRDSSSSNDSGVSSCSMKHAVEFQDYEMPLTSGHSQYQVMIHRRARGSLSCGHFSLPRKSKSSDILRDNSMQLFRGDQMPTKSTSAEAEVPVLPPKQFKGVVDGHSTSSGTSDMSDYIETLSIASSHSSTDTPASNNRITRAQTNTLRPRSGKEYHVSAGYSGPGYGGPGCSRPGYSTCGNYTNLP